MKPLFMQVVWALVALAVAILISMALISLSVDVQGNVPPLQHSEYDAKLDEHDRAALEAAYERQVEKLYTIWVQDPKDQPTRALRGIRTARQAYIDAMRGIEARPKP